MNINSQRQPEPGYDPDGFQKIQEAVTHVIHAFGIKAHQIIIPDDGARYFVGANISVDAVDRQIDFNANLIY